MYKKGVIMEEKNNIEKVMPMIMIVFILSGTLMEAFNISAPMISKDYAISSSTVSIQSSVSLLIMGVAYMIYASLSDFLSVRKLMIVGIVILSLGSAIGFLFTDSFIMVVISRSIQMAGGTCASALLILTATRYLNENNRMKYYGFNTACFSSGQAVGILMGGLFATYIGWKYLFLVPMLSLFTIPFILKYLPEDSKENKKKIDFVGLFLLACVSLFISLYFTVMNTYILIACILTIALFFIYITKKSDAFITIDFFKNKKYMNVMLIVFLTYSIQGSYSFLFSFMASKVHGIQLDTISMILLPSYLVSLAIGIFGSKITQKLGVIKTIAIAFTCLISALLLGASFLDRSIILLGFLSCLFNGGFSILYTPIMTMVINSLPKEKTGAGLGFFNLCIKITSSIGIVITGKLLTIESMQTNAIVSFMKGEGIIYSNILLGFVICILLSSIAVSIAKRNLDLSK